MTEIRNYTYTSVLSPYIEGFIAEKRSLGFIYNSEAYELFRVVHGDGAVLYERHQEAVDAVEHAS